MTDMTAARDPAQAVQELEPREYALSCGWADDPTEGAIYMPPGRHAPPFYAGVAYHGNKKIKGYQKGKRGKHGH